MARSSTTLALSGIALLLLSIAPTTRAQHTRAKFEAALPQLNVRVNQAITDSATIARRQAGPPGGGGGGGGGGAPRTTFPLLAQLVRLVFHGCVYGCHGKINMDPGHMGLEEPIALLDAMYEEELPGQAGARFSTEMSKADFWIAAGTIALQRASRIANANSGGGVADTLTPTFFYGRLDSNEGNMDQDLPDPHGGLEQVNAFFSAAFASTGWEQTDAVAIMGAHTLGRARIVNSGYSGTWVDNPDSLDNRYYIDLVQRPWTQVPVPTNEEDHQWVRGNGGNGVMMLNTDIALWKDHGANQETGITTCRNNNMNNCPDSNAAARSAVQSFVDSNDAWLRAFSTAWDKMVQNGYITNGQRSLRSVPYTSVAVQGGSDTTATTGTTTGTMTGATNTGAALGGAGGTVDLETGGRGTGGDGGPNLGLIIGAAVGGIVALALIGAMLWKLALHKGGGKTGGKNTLPTALVFSNLPEAHIRAFVIGNNHKPTAPDFPPTHNATNHHYPQLQPRTDVLQHPQPPPYDQLRATVVSVRN